jgi:hypothetical protein
VVKDNGGKTGLGRFGMAVFNVCWFWHVLVV